MCTHCDIINHAFYGYSIYMYRYDSVTTLFTKSELLTKRELIGRQRAKVQLLLRWAVTHTLKIKGAYIYHTPDIPQLRHYMWHRTGYSSCHSKDILKLWVITDHIWRSNPDPILIFSQLLRPKITFYDDRVRQLVRCWVLAVRLS